MRLNEIEHQQIYYHASSRELPVGTILIGRKSDYEKDWGYVPFYEVLEKYRPSNMIAHRDAVFMVGDEDDLDGGGGGTEYVFQLKPLSSVERHDMNWSSEISSLVDDGYDYNSPEIKQAAENYWNGVPHHNESLWEYLTLKAEIVKVEEY